MAWRKPYFDVPNFCFDWSVVGRRSGFVRRRGPYVGRVVRLVWSYVCLVNEEAQDTIKLVAVIKKAFKIR